MKTEMNVIPPADWLRLQIQLENIKIVWRLWATNSALSYKHITNDRINENRMNEICSFETGGWLI